MRLQVNNRGEIITSGERQTVGDRLVIRFLQTFKIPENSVAEKITGKFEGEVLYVTVPKLKQDDNITKISNIPKLKKKPKNDNNVSKPKIDDNITKSSNMDGDGSDKNHCKIAEKVNFDGQGIITEDWNMAEESSMLLRSVFKNLKENKGILITAVLAFSLGVLVSRKLSK